MSRSLRCLLPLLLIATVANARTVIQGFDDLATSGWTTANRSEPQGPPADTSSWFQGNTAVFPAQSGAANSYAAANFTGAAFGGDISTWLISPILTLREGSVFTFYTRTEFNPAATPDRLEVRFSMSPGRDPGANSTSVGDFDTLWLTINPTLSPTGYPGNWTQYSIPISAAFTQQGRVAFRYTVPDTSVNGDYIGIDTVQYDMVPEPGTWMLAMLAIPVFAIIRSLQSKAARRL